jgi:hypothetical protein
LPRLIEPQYHLDALVYPELHAKYGLILNPFSATQTTAPVDVTQATPFDNFVKTADKLLAHAEQVKKMICFLTTTRML